MPPMILCSRCPPARHPPACLHACMLAFTHATVQRWHFFLLPGLAAPDAGLHASQMTCPGAIENTHSSRVLSRYPSFLTPYLPRPHPPEPQVPITSELGCVTPRLVVPGPWSDKEITHHARQLAEGDLAGGTLVAMLACSSRLRLHLLLLAQKLAL